MDDSYSSVSGTFDVNEDAAKEDSDEESDSSSSSSAYPDEVMKVLRTLKDGEIGPDVIETDTSYYVVKLDKVNDEEATETKKQSMITDKQDKYYKKVLKKWKKEEKITVHKGSWNKISFTKLSVKAKDTSTTGTGSTSGN